MGTTWAQTRLQTEISPHPMSQLPSHILIPIAACMRPHPDCSTAGAGTPTYTAPEVVNGSESYGLKADVWSMGVVFYEMFTGNTLPVYKDKRVRP